MRVCLLTLALVQLMFIGCSPCPLVACEQCPPHFELRVTDGLTGEPVAGVTVVGADSVCSDAVAYTSCTPTGSAGPGSFPVTVTAPGYAPQELTVTVRSVDTSGQCCSCGYEPQAVPVELTPQ